MNEKLINAKYINLACGSNFIISNEWLNFDYVERDGINKIDLFDLYLFKA